MPYKIEKWCCNICSYEHKDEKTAKFCESKGIPAQTKNIKIDQEVKFFRQVPVKESMILTYKEYSGVVKDKYTVLNEKSDKHHDILIVATADKTPSGGIIEEYECIVAYTDIAQEGYQLVSPPIPKYQLGFGEASRKRREELKAKYVLE